MVLRMRRETPASLTSQPPQFDTLLLLDRNIDLLSPLITQLTYEGLIDEFFSIQNSESWKNYCTCILDMDSLLMDEWMVI